MADIHHHGSYPACPPSVLPAKFYTFSPCNSASRYGHGTKKTPFIGFTTNKLYAKRCFSVVSSGKKRNNQNASKQHKPVNIPSLFRQKWYHRSKVSARCPCFEEDNVRTLILRHIKDGSPAINHESAG